MLSLGCNQGFFYGLTMVKQWCAPNENGVTIFP